MQLVHGCKHFADVKSGVFLFEHAGVVQQSPKVSSWYVFHCEVDVFRVLKSVEKPNEPRSLRRGQNVAFDEDMANLESMSRVYSVKELLTSSILNNVRFFIRFKAQISPVSCFRARKTSP